MVIYKILFRLSHYSCQIAFRIFSVPVTPALARFSSDPVRKYGPLSHIMEYCSTPCINISRWSQSEICLVRDRPALGHNLNALSHFPGIFRPWLTHANFFRLFLAAGKYRNMSGNLAGEDLFEVSRCKLTS